MRKFYTSEVEHLMQLHFNRLSEKEKRQYAAIESRKLSYGGKMYISRFLGTSRNRIEKEIKELKNPSLYEVILPNKQRKTGGGLNTVFIDIQMLKTS